MKPRLLLAPASALLALALVGALASWATDGFASFTSEAWRRADVLARPRPLPEVALQDHSARALSMSQLCAGKVLVLDFIYTRCTSVCRAQGALAAQLAGRLQDLGEQAQVLSISFDPQQDTPAALLAFKQQHEGLLTTPWALLRPSQAEGRQALLKSFGVQVIADERGGFEHNAALHLVQGCRLVEVLDAEDIAGAEAAVRRFTAAPQV